MHPERIAKADKKMFNDLDYECIEFPVSKRDCCKIGQKNMFASMCFVMKIIWFILLMNQIKNVKIVWVY